jgi:rod shape-determining protein MreB
MVAAIGAGTAHYRALRKHGGWISAAETTDIAVISLSGIVVQPIRPTCRKRNGRRHHAITSNENTISSSANELLSRSRSEIGSAYPLDEPLSMEIKGRNLIAGNSKDIGDHG